MYWPEYLSAQFSIEHKLKFEYTEGIQTAHYTAFIARTGLGWRQEGGYGAVARPYCGG